VTVPIAARPVLLELMVLLVQMASLELRDPPGPLVNQELRHHQSPSHQATARNARPASQAHQVNQEKLDLTARLVHRAMQVRRANQAALEEPVHLAPLEKLAQQAKMGKPVLLEKMARKDRRAPTDHPAHRDPPDQRERTDPTVLPARMDNPANLDQLESPDRPETLAHREPQANPDHQVHQAPTPSTAPAHAVPSSTRSRRPKQHQQLSHLPSSPPSINTTTTLSSVLYFLLHWCWSTQSLRSVRP